MQLCRSQNAIQCKLSFLSREQPLSCDIILGGIRSDERTAKPILLSIAMLLRVSSSLSRQNASPRRDGSAIIAEGNQNAHCSLSRATFYLEITSKLDVCIIASHGKRTLHEQENELQLIFENAEEAFTSSSSFL